MLFYKGFFICKSLYVDINFKLNVIKMMYEFKNI